MTSYHALVIAMVMLFVREGHSLNPCKVRECPRGEECVSVVPNCGRPPCTRIGYCVKTAGDICPAISPWCPPCPVNQARMYDARGCRTCRCYDPCLMMLCRRDQVCVVRGVDECVRAVCIDRQYLMCHAWGDPHYVTFDGAEIAYQGLWWHIMTQRKNQGYCQFLRDFQVLVEHVYIPELRPGTSVVRQIMLIVPGVVIINIGPNNVMNVSGIIPSDWSITHVMIRRQTSLHIQRDILMLRIETSFGLVLTFDGRYWVSVSISPIYRNCVEGLCGNADGNKWNDYRTLQGADVSRLPLNRKFWAIGNSMRVNMKPSTRSRSRKPVRLEAAPLTGKEQQVDKEDLSCKDDMMETVDSDPYCGLLKKKDGPFGKCIEMMPELAASMYNGCKYDVCANQYHRMQAMVMVESSITTFVSACARKGLLAKIETQREERFKLADRMA